MTTESWTVIYREGGKERCRWVKVTETFGSEEDAEDMAAGLEHSGYFTIVRTSNEHRVAGSPVGWTMDHWREQIDTHHITEEGWWEPKPPKPPPPPPPCEWPVMLWTYEIIDHDTLEGIDSAEEVLSTRIWHTRDEAKADCERELKALGLWSEVHPWNKYGMVASLSWQGDREEGLYANVFPLWLQPAIPT